MVDHLMSMINGIMTIVDLLVVTELLRRVLPKINFLHFGPAADASLI